MALKKCSECKGDVSSSAKSCPHCGNKLKAGFFSKLFIFFIFLMIFGSILAGLTQQKKSDDLAKMSAEERKIFEENRIRDEEAFKKVVQVIYSIKKSLRDPNSLEFESISADDQASIICVEYRAKNGFGGMNSEIAVFFENKISRDTTMWNKKCANQPLKNFKHAKYALDRLN
jgi:hypothetical protein